MYQNNRKWLFLGVYKPPNQNDIEFLNRIGENLDYYFQKNDNVTIIGDFNITNENTHLQSMMQAYNLNNLIKETTCFQPNNHSQIDLILTNQKSMYKFSNTFVTSLSDHHKLISTVSKSGSFKGTPRIKIYRSYKSFNIDNFKSILNQKLNNLSSTTYDDFEETFLSLLNKHATLEKKILRHNNGPFMTKELRNEIMKRSKLKNKHNKRNYENLSLYKKQRN